MTGQLRTVIPVWGAVAIGAVLVGVLAAPRDYLQWLAIVLAGGCVLSFCIELALARKVGVVDRIMASVGGAIVILALATLVLSLHAATAR